MPGIWDFIDATAMALLNWRNPAVGLGARSAASRDDFVLGTAKAFGTEAPAEDDLVTIAMPAFAKPLAAFGASGSGKTKTLGLIRDYLIERQETLVDIDFRGDGFDRSVRGLVAAEVSADRVSLFDLRNSSQRIPLNFLGYGPGDSHTRAAIVYSALTEQAGSVGVQWGPDLRATLIALAETQGSLLDVPAALAPGKDGLRKDLVSQVKDEYANNFLCAFDELSLDAQRTRAAAVTNKLDDYLSHPALRSALGMAAAPDIQALIDAPGHITLVALGADRVPHAGLIGRMLVSAIQRAAMSRVDLPERHRTPCRLLVDEAQNLLGEESCYILAEGRRFGLALFLSCQFIGQLPAELRASVKVNCHTQFYFQTSAAEAADIAGEVVSSLSRDEVRKALLSAPVGRAVVVRRGQPAAYVQTINAPEPEPSGTAVQEFKLAVAARQVLPDRMPTKARRKSRSKRSQEVVEDVRKPFKRPSA